MRHRGLRHRFRSWLVVAAIVGALIVVVGVLLVLRLLIHDPTLDFPSRRGALLRVIVEEDREEDGYRRELVRLISTSGLEVGLAIKSPRVSDGKEAPQRPVLLLLPGFRTGERAVDLVGDTHGVILAAAGYPFSGARGARGLALLSQVAAIRRGVLDTPPAIMLALDYLLGRPDVDRERVELAGVSLGAPFAVISGGLDPRPSRVWSIHGGGGPFSLIDGMLRREVGSPPLRAVVTSFAYLLASGRWLAPERFAPRIAPRPLIMINAAEDRTVPHDSVMLLYDSARQPKELVWMPGEHVRAHRAEIVDHIVDLVLARMERAPLAD
jgi:fermentation-respiration switch protein FrsA (DUF1100 family)